MAEIGIPQEIRKREDFERSIKKATSPIIAKRVQELGIREQDVYNFRRSRGFVYCSIIDLCTFGAIGALENIVKEIRGIE